jgi:uncharacterized membrane protein YedE/YeeE
MRAALAAFLIGSLFGGGLIVSGMTNPAKVQNFLDIFGQWDPTLAFVMGGALLTTFIGYRLVWRRSSPLDAASFDIPTTSEVTKPLLIGSGLFGVGWGLAGLCPGPAIAVLPMAPVDATIFFVGLYGGILAFQLTNRAAASPSTTSSAKAAPSK